MVQSLYNSAQNIGALGELAGDFSSPIKISEFTVINTGKKTIISKTYGIYTIKITPTVAGYPSFKADISKLNPSDTMSIDNQAGPGVDNVFILYWDPGSFVEISVNNTNYAGNYILQINI